MSTPADLALQRQLQAPEAGAASKVVTALWVLGLFTASVAITLAMPEPLPMPGLHKNAYLLALSVAFFAGMAGVMAAVCIGWPTTPAAAGRRATGRKKLVYSAAAVAVGGFMVVVSLLW
jgi:hypothetical protein